MNDQILQFSRAVICTGATTAIPLIPGLRKIDFLTNETIFNLTELPNRIAIVGGGPVGIEMAQAFATFGSKVVVFETHSRILPKEDCEAAMRIQKKLHETFGVEFYFCQKIQQIAYKNPNYSITNNNNNANKKQKKLQKQKQKQKQQRKQRNQRKSSSSSSSSSSSNHQEDDDTKDANESDEEEEEEEEEESDLEDTSSDEDVVLGINDNPIVITIRGKVHNTLHTTHTTRYSRAHSLSLFSFSTTH